MEIWLGDFGVGVVEEEEEEIHSKNTLIFFFVLKTVKVKKILFIVICSTCLK